MVHGKAGMYLEAWKFGVYLFIPLVASAYYADPENQKYWADYYQFIKYPENPNTNVKDKIEELVKQKELQKEQRQAYQDQLRQLQEAAERSANYQSENNASSVESKSVWRRLGGLFGGS